TISTRSRIGSEARLPTGGGWREPPPREGWWTEAGGEARRGSGRGPRGAAPAASGRDSSTARQGRSYGGIGPRCALWQRCAAAQLPQPDELAEALAQQDDQPADPRVGRDGDDDGSERSERERHQR